MVKFFTVILVYLISMPTIAQQIGDTQTGQLHFYNDIYHGKPTASGEVYDKTKISAAHKSLPMKTMVEVENLENNKSIFVEINDRTPEDSEAILELSRAAAEQLDFINEGVTKGRIRIIQVLQSNATTPTPTTHIKNTSRPKLKEKIVKTKPILINDRIETTVSENENHVDVDTPSLTDEDEMLIENAIKIGNDKYAIQLGAFKEKASLNLTLKLANKNGMYLKKDLFILTEKTSNGQLYKLIYGYFGEDLARTKMEEIKPHFKDSFIKKF